MFPKITGGAKASQELLWSSLIERPDEVGELGILCDVQKLVLMEGLGKNIFSTS